MLTTKTLPAQIESEPLSTLDDAALGSFARETCETATREGAVVVRGLDITSPPDLARFGRATGFPIETFGEESSPRTPLGGGVATSTEYLAGYPIQLHNEFSYARRWPRFVLFACLEAPADGGETPLADSAALLADLSTTTRRTFEDRGLRYERNYLPHSGVDWMRAFDTDDPTVVEGYCGEHGLSFEWREDGSLTTRKTGHAIRRHPGTGTEVWFNHLLLFSASGLEPPSLRRIFERQPPQQRSSNVTFADGSPIPSELFDEVRDVTNAARRARPWRNGELLVVDNMLVAHGRMPFTGSRRVVVTMLGHWDESRDG